MVSPPGTPAGEGAGCAGQRTHVSGSPTSRWPPTPIMAKHHDHQHDGHDHPYHSSDGQEIPIIISEPVHYLCGCLQIYHTLSTGTGLCLDTGAGVKAPTLIAQGHAARRGKPRLVTLVVAAGPIS